MVMDKLSLVSSLRLSFATPSKKGRYNNNNNNAMKVVILLLAEFGVLIWHLVSACSCSASPILGFFLGQLFMGLWIWFLKEKEEGTAEQWWKKHEKESVGALLFSPFFVCVAADNLELKTFFNFMLDAYHSFKAVHEACETMDHGTDDDGHKSAIGYFRVSVYKKFYSYRNFIRKRGLQLSKEKISPVTAKYIDFLLTTASGKVDGERVEKVKVAAYTVAVIAPLMRLNSHLCHVILGHQYPKTTPHIYKKWLEAKSSLFLETLAQEAEDLLDKLSVSMTKEELKVTQKLYDQSMKLQMEFFASQRISQPTVVPLTRVQDLNKIQLTIFSNFDLTCSVVNSSAMPAELAIITSPEDMKKGFGQWVNSIIHGVPAKYFDYKGLRKAIEKRAKARVEESGVLEGKLQDRIKHAGQDLRLHKGCREFFQKIVKNENPSIDVHVISYCWCGDLIRSAFSPDLEALHIHSNDLVYVDSITTGRIDKKVESPLEKLRVFREVLEGHKRSTEGKHLRVYIGGGVGDLLCLVEADIGIVFGGSESLKKLGMHFGVSFVSLLHGVVKNQMENGKWKSQYGILYTVDSWAEIQAFILGL